MSRAKGFATVAALAALGTIVLAQPVLAQSTRDRVTTLEANVARLERLLENNQTMQTDLLRRLRDLQAENQALRETLDQLQFQTTQGADRQRQLYLDLDQRLQALESRGAVPSPDGAAAGGNLPVGTALSDAESYQAAFDLLKQGRYDEAQAAFRSFLDSYAESDMRGNAQYWLAETYYVTKAFDEALVQFRKVVSDYPTTRKLPDAWLKIGFCEYEKQRWNEARNALNTVVARFGDTTAAQLARQRLAEMQKQGR